VTSWRERTASYFVAPTAALAVPPAAGAFPVSATREAPQVAVLGSAGHAGGIARLLAAELRVRTHAGCVLVGEWCPDAVVPAAGGGARPARELARRLEGRGLEARARGRLVLLSMAGDAAAAATEWTRAAAVADCPAICVLSRARTAPLDALLELQDLLVVVVPLEAGPEMLELACEGLAGLPAPVIACRPVPRTAARLAVASPFAASRVIDAGLLDAVRAMT